MLRLGDSTRCQPIDPRPRQNCLKTRFLRWSISHSKKNSVALFARHLIGIESSARDILPFSFRQCTAPLGPLRQALYACLTCAPVPSSEQKGAICYSCSIQCHGSHNLVELFCKRDFTCDCGTIRMGSTPCSLRKTASQPPITGNAYNHNFEGRFCTCDKEYDVNAEEGTMFQCLVCEDWFHEKCIGERRVPDQDDFDAFVCQDCVGKNVWLGRYVAIKEGFLSTLETYPEIQVDVEKVDVSATHDIPASSGSRLPETIPAETASIHRTETSSATTAVKRSLSTEPETSEPSSKRVKVETVDEDNDSSDQCKWSALPVPPKTLFALFLKEDFRDHLCRCLACETLRLRNLPMISTEEETYEPDEDNSDTGTDPIILICSASLPRRLYLSSIPLTSMYLTHFRRLVTGCRNKGT